MATLMLDSAQLEIALTPAEKLMAGRKQNVAVDRTAIRRVQLTDDAWTWLSGIRSPGTFIPATLAIGTWKSAAGSDFAVIRRKRPGVVIDLAAGGEFRRIIITTKHGVALVQALRLEGTDEFEDVAEIAGD